MECAEGRSLHRARCRKWRLLPSVAFAEKDRTQARGFKSAIRGSASEAKRPSMTAAAGRIASSRASQGRHDYYRSSVAYLKQFGQTAKSNEPREFDRNG